MIDEWVVISFGRGGGGFWWVGGIRKGIFNLLFNGKLIKCLLLFFIFKF